MLKHLGTPDELIKTVDALTGKGKYILEMFSKQLRETEIKKQKRGGGGRKEMRKNQKEKRKLCVGRLMLEFVLSPSCLPKNQK